MKKYIFSIKIIALDLEKINILVYKIPCSLLQLTPEIR